MTNNLPLLKTILITVFAASLASIALGIHATIAVCVAATTLILLIAFLTKHKQVTMDGFASAEARFIITSKRDKLFWGIKPKYDDTILLLPILGIFLGPYSFFSAIDAANGTSLSHFEKLIYALLGTPGVVFMWEVAGIIICISTIEFSYYLWKRKQSKPS